MNTALTLDGRDTNVELLQIQYLKGLMNSIEHHSTKISTIETEVVKLKDAFEKEMYLTPAQCQATRNAVSKRVNELLEENPDKKSLRRKYFSALWQAVKNRFEVNTYLVIPRNRFSSVLLYVGSWYPITPIE